MPTRVEKEWPNVFEVENGAIVSPDGVVLGDLDFAIRDRCVTVILGPSGSGKSTLLHVLSGADANALESFTVSGTWRMYEPPGRTKAFLAQRASVARDAVSSHARPPHWRDVTASGATTLFLDEPSFANDAERDALTTALQSHAAHGAAILVTHHVSFARAVAGHVLLVAAGRILARGESPGFFEHPSSPLVERFLRWGNCWPRSAWPPPLPSHFRWILPDRLGGMGRPGLLGREEDDLAALAAAGVSLLVNLTDDPIAPAALRAYGIEGRLHPVPDMGVPALSATASLCRGIEQAMSGGNAVVLHCRAGLGRTGTLLASMLVWLGEEPAAAIAKVRSENRGYLQNAQQMNFVHRFAASVARATPASREPLHFDDIPTRPGEHR